MYDPTYIKYLKVTKFIEIKGRMVVSRAERIPHGVLLFKPEDKGRALPLGNVNPELHLAAGIQPLVIPDPNGSKLENKGNKCLAFNLQNHSTTEGQKVFRRFKACPQHKHSDGQAR